VLSKIDGVWAMFELRETEAQVAAAQATLDQSERDYKYLHTLQERGSAKLKEVDDAKSQVASDRAVLEAAIAIRDRAKERVARLAIVAPFDGAVVAKLVEPGQWVESGTAVAEMITTGSIDAQVFVPERYIGSMQVGQVVSVTIEPLSRRVTGPVTAIIPRATNAARTFPLKVRLDDQAGHLKSGMSVVAHLPICDALPRLIVPRDAVMFSGPDAVVWTAVTAADHAEENAGDSGDAGGSGGDAMPSALPVAVKVLFSITDHYVVQPINGDILEVGAAVVIQGAERLIRNQSLIIDDPADTPDTPDTSDTP